MSYKLLEMMLVFFLSLNLFSGILLTSGAAADIGIDARVSGDTAAEGTQESLEEVNVNSGAAESIITAVVGLVSTLNKAKDVAYAGPVMLENAGAPGFITGPLKALVTVVYALGLIRFIRGIA